MNWLYRISFYRRIQTALLLFLIFPLLLISGFTFMANKQANEENIRTSMEGIIGILANDLSKTANDVTYTVNQFSLPQTNGVFNSLRNLKYLQSFNNFNEYRDYANLNENATLLIGKLSLVHVSVFFVNKEYYPIVGSIKSEDVAELRRDKRFEHMRGSEAASGIVEWFRVEKSGGYEGVFGEDYYYFIKKSVYDPIRHEVLGTLFIGIPESYFRKLLLNSSGGVISLYEKDGELIAGTKGSMDHLSAKPLSGWMREQVDVPGTSWQLTYDIEKKSVAGNLVQRYSYMLIAMVIVLFIFLFMSIVIARGLNQPIGKLMRIVKQYGEGNTLIRYNLKGQDEISVLGNTINHMMDNINTLISKVEAEQEEKRIIELYALFSQIQPHFLFNTLNSIKCNLALEGNQTQSEAIDSLMSLLRAHLRAGEPHQLAEEYRLLTQYVSIMRMRNRLDIEFSVELPEQFRSFSVPRMLLQPLVENSIVHGMTRHVMNPSICVRVEEVDEGVEIQIEDNGKGIDEAQAKVLNERLLKGAEQQGERGVGLYNVLRRLKLTYGDKASLTIRSGIPAGCVCILFIPITEEGQRGDVT
ncbi:histidine kinase [Paenibacillus sp. FA6]|uniref:histidine kinase n=1 Tax=Paenibacillus sp. FA6 TaxID=3413029 RepID=UPI003F65E6D9